jgi:uncharacterized membrane protein
MTQNFWLGLMKMLFAQALFYLDKILTYTYEVKSGRQTKIKNKTREQKLKQHFAQLLNKINKMSW